MKIISWGFYMSKQTERTYGISRLESKTARAAIIQKIATDFNLMPIIAEAYYKQISSYFVQHADIELTSGQICYEAVAANEPAGKHIALTRKVSCRLTLNDVNTDFETRERRKKCPSNHTETWKSGSEVAQSLQKSTV
jgi:hypothetical protein